MRLLVLFIDRMKYQCLQAVSFKLGCQWSKEIPFTLVSQDIYNQRYFVYVFETSIVHNLSFIRQSWVHSILSSYILQVDFMVYKCSQFPLRRLGKNLQSGITLSNPLVSFSLVIIENHCPDGS